MKGLEQLLNWKLLKGSHKFPGPDGGTCINEAAIVVAGFEYRKVNLVADLPPCFSVPLSAFALVLNDHMMGYQRQKLIPFVVRLAGSKDSSDVEMQRATFIVTEMKKAVEAVWKTNCCAVYAAENALNRALFGEGRRRVNTIEDAMYNLSGAVADLAASHGQDDVMISILDRACKIGKQADPIEHAVIEQRVKEAKAKAAERVDAKAAERVDA